MIKTKAYPDPLEVIAVAGKARSFHLRWQGRLDAPMCGYRPKGRYGWRHHTDIELKDFKGYGGRLHLCPGCEEEAVGKCGGLVSA